MKLNEFLDMHDPERKDVRDGTWEGCFGTGRKPYTKTRMCTSLLPALHGCDLLFLDIDDTLVNSRDELTDPLWTETVRTAHANGTYVCIVSSRMPEDHADAYTILTRLDIPYDQCVFTCGNYKTTVYVQTIQQRAPRHVVIVDDNTSVLMWAARRLCLIPITIYMFCWSS